ncbi:helix-turn-helix transcriptional regulator [Paenibacillus eucommiae]|uniref:DNA-binding transcriptional regulator YafY n=1 Tax=Paenibacillus eucommiae TaxID=1355755 RepID=A0ABS4IQA5_9BACL|nr:YafY family protein [Paenibacillus eucommiae]MBP1989753.1 putative DNA-binding transcriptional regulator YafY [Paenibacillus eucommiae]
MKLDRMLGITVELMTKRRVTATELAARFEVSIRTIYRDVELINQAGIPIASYTGTVGGFELMNGFFITKQHFSIDDFSVIYNLLKGMEGAMGGKSTSLMHKLTSVQPALLNGGHHDKIIFDMSTSANEKAIVHPLFQAIHQTRKITISYTSTSGTLTERQVEPIILYWERGAWYLEGYCLLRKAKRIFRVSRITQFEVSDDQFLPRKAYNLLAEEEVQGTQVHLHFDLKAQPRVLEQFQGECIHRGDHIEVHTDFYSREYAISIILSFGSKVKIIAPDDLMKDFIRQLKQIQNQYEGEGIT